MTRALCPLVHGWVVLLALVAVQLGCSFLPLPRSLRPLLLLPALGMVAVVGIVFMRVTASPAIARGFAIAALFWLIIILGLGMMDPLTRTIYPVVIGGVQ